jgi:hypothetical protein
VFRIINIEGRGSSRPLKGRVSAATNSMTPDPIDYSRLTEAELSLIPLSAVEFNPEKHKAMEAGYRRGVHQALAFAGYLIQRASSRRAAARLVARAEALAEDFRYVRKDEGGGMLLDLIERELSPTPSPGDPNA